MAWGLSELTFMAPGRKKSYTVSFNRRRGLKIIARLAKNAVRFALGFNRYVDQYQDAYPKTASSEYWKTVYVNPPEIGATTPTEDREEIQVVAKSSVTDTQKLKSADKNIRKLQKELNRVAKERDTLKAMVEK